MIRMQKKVAQEMIWLRHLSQGWFLSGLDADAFLDVDVTFVFIVLLSSRQFVFMFCVLPLHDLCCLIGFD